MCSSKGYNQTECMLILITRPKVQTCFHGLPQCSPLSPLPQENFQNPAGLVSSELFVQDVVFLSECSPACKQEWLGWKLP